MPNENSAGSTTISSPRPSRLWRWVRRGLVGLAVFVTLLFVVVTEENWRGKRAWENFRREWEAKGEKFYFKDFVPPPVPDDQNFAMTPLLAPLFDYNPRPLKPGQSQWRDTNGLARVDNFAKDLPSPKTRMDSWITSQRMNLGIWAVAFEGKTNENQVAGITLPETKAAAAAVLQGLEKYRSTLDEIQAATHRPYARFNIGYDEENIPEILLPHLAIVKRLANIFQLRATAELAAGKTDEALADIVVIVRMADSLRGEPFLISGLVRLSMLHVALQPVWEGLAGHQWSDAQLAELENQLGKIDLLTEYSSLIRGERTHANGAMEYYLHNRRRMNELSGINDENGQVSKGAGAGAFMPAGFLYQNELTINRMYQEIVFPTVDAAQHRVFPQVTEQGAVTVDKELTHGFTPYKIFARLLFPAIGGAVKKFAMLQTSVEEAQVACALERCRLANGQYPDTLAALAPQFIKAVPQDVIGGGPLKYRRTEEGQFVLYSVGWNERDDGGKVVFTTGLSPHPDITKGDWVWPAYPVAK